MEQATHEARREKRNAERAENLARAAKVAQLAAAGRTLRLRTAADMPLVSVARTFELREDVFDAARNASLCGLRFDNYEAAMMGGEPYSVWH